MTRIMRVFHQEENKMHFDFFKKEEWSKIINAFFITGGLEIPDEINTEKTLDNLTEEDYTVFFEELGYTVVSFEDVDKEDLSLINTIVALPKEGEIH